MRWRKTHDLDLSLSVSIDEYPAGLDQVAGWAQDRRMEHEWTSPDGVKVDVLPYGRERDLQDLAYLLDEYLLDDEDRRFAQEILERDLKFENTNTFLLGTDIAAMADDAERQIVSGFFDRLQDDQDPMAARMFHLAPAIWRETPQVLVDRVRAFKQGFDATE